jgi:hypothetical protein
MDTCTTMAEYMSSKQPTRVKNRLRSSRNNSGEWTTVVVQ